MLKHQIVAANDVDCQNQRISAQVLQEMAEDITSSSSTTRIRVNHDANIISRMNDYLHKAAQALASWLSVMLPKSGEDWWEECVLSNLGYPQRELIEKKGSF